MSSPNDLDRSDESAAPLSRAMPGESYATGLNGASDLFQGGGELGARMRALNWADTPLGPVETWPQSLRTCVRIILTSRQPMFVWWGESLINLYNDPYKAIVGGKHPEALAKPAAEVWREIWDQVGPRAQHAMRGNEGTYDEALLLIMQRHGYEEETYYTFSYSPVPNERGGTGGILCANTDDTQRIIGERRVALLRDLASRTSDARRVEDACVEAARALSTDPKDFPFALIYLTDPGSNGLVLAGAAGVAPGHPAAPWRLPAPNDELWPVWQALRAHDHIVVPDLEQRLAHETDHPPLGAAAWGRPCERAVVWPLSSAPGGTGRPGVLIAGLNPFRPLDRDYETFLSLTTGQITAAMANAQAYEEERRRAEALAAIDRAKTAFFSNVSHEFRTPLTLILGPVEDALGTPERAVAGESLHAIHRNTLRLLKLVNTLLDFSRIEAGRTQARYEPTDLALLTRDLASAFRAAIERGGVTYQVHCEPVDEPIYVDRGMWEKIVLNLLSNAFKFTLEGHIVISLQGTAEGVELRVADTGCGIPPAELPRVFERFHRVEGSRGRTHEGSGIGLALVKELVALHGGTIEVDSEVGRGSVFTVRLPRGYAHLPAQHVVARADAPLARTLATAPFVEEALRWLPEAEPPVGGNAGVESVANPSPHSGRVLIADDNADMREYLTRLLQGAWQVQSAADGERALAAARAWRPDIVLTDVMMPNLDGFGLLRAMRADLALARTPVIMLSARAGDESRVEGLDAGADDYLVKPFSAQELVARVRIHVELARLRRAAESERDRLRSLLTQVPAIVNFLRGPDLVVEFLHPMAAAALGGRDVVGRPLLEAIPEFAGQEYPTLLRHVFDTGEPVRGSEKRVWLKDETGALRETFWNFIYLPVRDDTGRIEGVMTFDIEVTEQLRATQRLAFAREEAERANRAKDEFLAMLGHELRNPLSPILTALQLMRMRGVESREQAVIERQVGHLVRLVDDLLDVSRITRGKIDLRRARIEIAAAVGAGLEMARPLLEQRRQKLEIDVPPEGMTVDGDLNRLGQVVSNLLTNAAKYSDPGTTIRVSAQADAQFVTLTVRDEGVGLAPETLGRVFDLFYQQPQAIDRAKGGLGLGLAIVRSLVELHGGEVRVASAGLGQGSAFSVRLPIAQAGDEPVAPRVGLITGSDEAPSASRGLRVLVVDDNTDAADALADLLTALGHEPRTAPDGPTALAVAAAFAPELCLLDIGLPVMDGYELAVKLRQSGALAPKARLLAITGYGQDADRKRALDAGFDAHLVKPVSLDRLLQALTSN